MKFATVLGVRTFSIPEKTGGVAMLRVAVTDLRPGMRVGKAILATDGRVLLQVGTELRETYIENLERLGVTAVYVFNELAPDVMPPDLVSDQTRATLTVSMKETLSELSRTFQLSIRAGSRRLSAGFAASKLKSAVDMVVSELMRNPRAILNLNDIRTADEYTLGHSVNVCILSVLLGSQAGLNAAQLHELGLGALMHDIGKIAIPTEVLNKPGALTPEEFALMREHTTLGWEILSTQQEISYTSSAMALQHHERWSGGGYPRGIKGTAIHQFSRICAVVDCYDAMTADRVYRKGFTPERALKSLNEISRDFFEPELLQLFCESVAPYPVGSLVEITDGYQAVVTAVERGKTTRPHVRVVIDPEGRPLAQPFAVDLFAEPHVHILSTVQDEAAEFIADLVS